MCSVPRLAAATATLLLGVVLVATAATTESELELQLAAGYDSNPLRVSRESEGSAFVEAVLDGSVERTGDRFGVFVDGRARARRHESPAADGDDSWGSIEGGVAFTPWRRSHRYLTFRTGLGYDLYRTIYVDPETGDIYQVGSAPSTPIPERFDHDTRRAFLDLRWRVGRRALLFVDSDLRERRYAEDYTKVGLDSLDHDSLTVRPGLRARVADSVLLDVSIEWSERHYDELPALDDDGSKFPGTLREYRYTGYQLSASFDVTTGLTLAAGVRQTSRDDLGAGYYDSQGSTPWAALSYSHGKTGLRLHVSRRDNRYDTATVGNDPDGAGRGSETLRVVGRVERDLGTRFGVFALVGAERSDDSDPIYDYDRDWVQTGLRLRY